MPASILRTVGPFSLQFLTNLAGRDLQDEAGVRQYYALLDQLASLRAALRQLLNDPKVALPFLQPGARARNAVDKVASAVMGEGWRGLSEV